MRYILLSLVALYFLNCTTTPESSTSESPKTELASPEPDKPVTIDITNFNTKSGLEFTVIEKQLSASMSRISVNGTGFPNSREIFTLRDVDPLETGLLADLDGNGYEELYLITRSSGSGSYATIYGFASYNDKSYGPIYIPEHSENDTNFKGYMGHDRIGVVNNELIREFPIYNNGDANNAPSGGSKVVRYTLIAGEANYTLTIEEVSNRR